MTKYRMQATATCVAALFCAGAAQADVTAQEVWDNWQQSFAVYGESGVSIGSESQVGPSLTISDLSFTMSDTDVDVSMTIPALVFTENGDGTVSVTMSESYPLIIQDSPQNIATLLITQTGLEMTVSGDTEEMIYDFSADKMSISLDEITEGGEPMDADVLFALNALTGSYVAKYGELNVTDYQMRTGGVDLLVDIKEPGGDGFFNLSGQIAEMTMGGSIAVPADMDYDMPETMFIDGFSIDAEYTFGQSAYLFNFQDGRDAANGTIAASEGVFDLALNYDNLEYGTSVNDLVVSVAGSDIPLPIDFSVGEYAIGLAMPLSATDEPADISANFRLADVAVNDMIWSMIDPGGMLSHDPATVNIDLSGMGRLFLDLMDPAQAMQAAGGDIPGELDSLSLNDLTISAVGAEILGSGAFAFDFSDFSTIPGVPRPEGELNISLNGINGLMDTLVQMGLLPEDELMAPRMMMGVFANTVGDDMLESKIEITPEGQILANGQRLQ